MKNLCKALVFIAWSAPSFASVQVEPQSASSRMKDFLIQSCLNQFEHHPFHEEPINARIIAPTINILNSSGSLSDEVPTDQPELVIISSSLNVFGNSTFKLLNPNAWYCLAANVSIHGVTNIDIHRDAHFVQLNLPIESEVNIRRVDDQGQPVPESEVD